MMFKQELFNDFDSMLLSSLSFFTYSQKALSNQLKPMNFDHIQEAPFNQVIKAQRLVQQLATGEVPGLNPDKGENY